MIASRGAMPIQVLMIDDDLRLFQMLQAYLEQNGVTAVHAGDGPLGLAAILRHAFDAVLLDIMLPGMDGLIVLKKIREKTSLPVIMLTAKGDETDRVVGLELGADDYLPKPFSPRELLARLRAVLRRGQVDPEKERLCVASVVVEVAARSVRAFGSPVELTGIEFDILVALMRRAGRVVARANLLDYAGRTDVTVNDRTVDVHVSHLRRKLGDDPPRLIKTVRGVGYVLAKDAT